MDASLIEGGIGQFDVVVDKKTVVTRGGNWFTRQFGAGYPDFGSVVEVIERTKERS